MDLEDVARVMWLEGDVIEIGNVALKASRVLLKSSLSFDRLGPRTFG